MATFTGTNGADTITPTTVSAGVIATAPFPGSDLDSLYGGLGNDCWTAAAGALRFMAAAATTRCSSNSAMTTLMADPAPTR